jgi:hypothetical protein
VRPPSLRRATLVLAVTLGMLAAPITAWAAEGDGDDDLPAQGAIVGGSVASAGAYPFVVGVLYHDTAVARGNYEAQFCGGTVVAARWIVTAAHCVTTRDSDGVGGQPINLTVLPLDVLVGTTRLDGSGSRIAVDQIVVHAEYLERYQQGVNGQPDDIALLHLSADVAASSAIPVAGPSLPTPAPGTVVRTMGWGSTTPGPPYSYPVDLLQVDLEIISDDACRSAGYQGHLVGDTMVCAYENGADACRGDSGGPLALATSSGWALVGVTSFGISCAVTAGVYTEVASYSAWIHGYIDPPPVATTTTTSPTPPPTTPPGDRGGPAPGYWMLGADCALYSFGAAKTFAGSAPPGCVAMTSTPDGSGVWLLDQSGRVTNLGSAPALGSPQLGGVAAAGISSTSSGLGYWVTDARGNVHAFGDAAFWGGVGHLPLNSPIIGMTTAPDGSGYWLLAADGGVFTFGGARFWGSTGAIRLNQPVVAMTATESGSGYWLVASDGGVFAFGDAAFFGSMGGTALNRPVNGMSRTPSGSGYWMVASDGGVFAFGDAPFVGSLGATPPSAPVVGLEPAF